jgi:hypothetical protein
MDDTPFLSLPELFTDADGRAKFRDMRRPLSEGSAAAALSRLEIGAGHQFRMSPVGFRSSFHCTITPQWLIVLQGVLEIGLQDGSLRVFQPGQCFFSNDVLPRGATFDAGIHGHSSRQVGEESLVTVFVRA